MIALAMTSHGDFHVTMHWFLIHLFMLAGLHIFSQLHGQMFGNGAQLVGCNKTIEHFIPLPMVLQGSIETRHQSHQPSDGSAASGSQPAPALAERQTLVKYAMWGAADMSSPFLRQLIGAVYELKAAIVIENVTCFVSVIRGRGAKAPRSKKLRL